MKSRKNLLLKLAVLLLSSAISLTAFTQSVTNVPTWQLDSLINDALAKKDAERVAALYKSGYDRYKFEYNQLAERYEESQLHVMRLQIERDTANKRIVDLRNEKSRERFRGDSLETRLTIVTNKKTKPVGFDLHTGYNPFTKSFYAGAGLSIRIFGFNPFPKPKENVYVPAPDNQFNRLFNK